MLGEKIHEGGSVRTASFEFREPRTPAQHLAGATASDGVDLTRFHSEFGFGHKVRRAVWGVVHTVAFRTSPRLFYGWRRLLLRAFGAKIGSRVRVYPSAQVWAPWNLIVDDNSVVGPGVECYCVAPIRIGPNSIISQYTYLCAASHDYSDPSMPLTMAPIVIGAQAWLCAGAFVGMGVNIGDGAVVGARACVTRDVPAWTIVAGNPAKELKQRIMTTSNDVSKR